MREGRIERKMKEEKKDEIHLVLQPGGEPNKTDNSTRSGHEANLDTPT